MTKEDITHKGFLKPLEIALKTYKTEMHEKENPLQRDSLPAGLKIAIKQSLESEKRNLKDVLEIYDAETYRNIRLSSMDNMLAFMKQTEGIELAICICMYSEDKKMLKNTLAGVADNIANLVAFEKIDPDKIGVFVMMDGI